MVEGAMSVRAHFARANIFYSKTSPEKGDFIQDVVLYINARRYYLGKTNMAWGIGGIIIGFFGGEGGCALNFALVK